MQVVLPVPFPPPLEVGTPNCGYGSGGALKLLHRSGSRQSPAAKHILTHFRPKFVPFEYLMQLTDTLSHIISHKRYTD